MKDVQKFLWQNNNTWRTWQEYVSEPSGVGGGGFNLVKIRGNSGKLPKNILTNLFLTSWQGRGSFGEHQRLIVRVCRKISDRNVVRTKKYSHKWPKDFFGQVRRDSSKDPALPHEFACSYTYVRPPHNHSQPPVKAWASWRRLRWRLLFRGDPPHFLKDASQLPFPSFDSLQNQSRSVPSKKILHWANVFFWWTCSWNQWRVARAMRYNYYFKFWMMQVR